MCPPVADSGAVRGGQGEREALAERMRTYFDERLWLETCPLRQPLPWPTLVVSQRSGNVAGRELGVVRKLIGARAPIASPESATPNNRR